MFINVSISNLTLTTRELAIDTTFRSNYAGMSLFAVLAELDGTRIPQASQYQERVGSDDSSDFGNLTHALVNTLRLSGLAPLFVRCDKVKTEMNDTPEVWSLTNVKPCF